MEQQSDWIEVEHPDLEDELALGRSMVVRVSVSPYDVPHHVRGAFDDRKKRFVVEFKYVDSEPTKMVRVGDHALAAVGRNSGRVYSLELDVAALKVDTIGLQMKADNAISNLASTVSPSLVREKNYALARSVIDAYWTPLSKFLSLGEGSSVHQVGAY